MSKLAASWGVVGVMALLAEAQLRLVPRAAEALAMDLGPAAWAVLAAWVAFMGYVEGWHGFHRRFSPRVIARAATLLGQPVGLRTVLAPLFCMSLFHASPRGLRVAWGVWVGVAALIVAVSTLAQPWRGIVDTGVVVGLGIGVVSLVWHGSRALMGIPAPIAADVPDEAPTMGTAPGASA